MTLPPGPFSVLYADPPWAYHTRSHRGQGKGAAQHYATMPAEDIRALPVRDIAADDAVLFLWVVQPQLPEALALIEAWGFTYKTVAFYWIKTSGRQERLFYGAEDARLGLGYHTRSSAEQCWLATRGKGYKRQSASVRQVVHAPLREHSRKPDEIATSIEQLTGDVPRIELFARTKRPGWSVWGNETDRFRGAA